MSSNLNLIVLVIIIKLIKSFRYVANKHSDSSSFFILVKYLFKSKFHPGYFIQSCYNKFL